jgi:hypothetical protein
MNPHHTLQCPICQQPLLAEEGSRHRVPRGMQGACQAFICYNPLANLPLHYYSHVVVDSNLDLIIFQEFSVDLDNKWIIFANNYVDETSSIRSSKNVEPLDVPVLLLPDFPNLDSLKSKIRMSLVFS